MFPVRVWFCKQDSAKYISHLDLNRLFTRAFNRSELNIWYTEGFNPHPFITFALPLSLGQESVCEIMDFKMNDHMPLNVIMDTLNNVLPPDIKILSAACPMLKAKEIGFAAYDVYLPIKDDNSIKNATEILRNEEPLTVTKKTKSSETVVNLKEHLKISEKDIIIKKDSLLIKPLLPAGSEQNFNPNLIVQGIENRLNEHFSFVKIVRKNIYDKKMQEFK